MVYYNPYYMFIFLWSLVWTLEVKNDKGLPLYPGYTYRVLQTIQMKLILLCVWAEWAVLGSAKTALKFKYEI